jgi:hypothetical protein
MENYHCHAGPSHNLPDYDPYENAGPFLIADYLHAFPDKAFPSNTKNL